MKKLVIIGGGFAGANIAKSLESKFNVTLIDTKDYFEFTPGILRTIVEPQHIRKIQVLHTHYLHKATIVKAQVLNITKTNVITKNQTIPYDYLTICSGSSYNLPFKEKNIIISERAIHLRNQNKNIEESKKIIIIGGGLVGVEIATEIVSHYKDKFITIVHAMDRLMERQPIKASKYAEKYLHSKGVNIIYNEFIAKVNNGIFISKNKAKFESDLAFLCVGIKSNSDFLHKNFKHFLNNRSQIKVNSHLQVFNHPNIFAAGDITDINEEKTAQNAENHAKIVSSNICRLEKGMVLLKYKPLSRVMVISLGKYNGLMSYKKYTATGIMPGILKSAIEWKTMMKYRNPISLNNTCP